MSEVLGVGLGARPPCPTKPPEPRKISFQIDAKISASFYYRFSFFLGIVLVAFFCIFNFDIKNGLQAKSLNILSNQKNAFLSGRWANADSFCSGDGKFSSPTLIGTHINGLTNQLFAYHQIIFIGRSLGLPVELTGYLHTGCEDYWGKCKKNELFQFGELFNMKKLSSNVGVRISDINQNYCYEKIIPHSNAVFDRSAYKKIQGRTLISINSTWAAYDTRGTDFSWIKFSGFLRKSFNSDIVSHCDLILKSLPYYFMCVHPRKDSDFFEEAIFNVLLKKQSSAVFVVTRVPLPAMYSNQSGIFTKFSFAGYAHNMRTLLLDACICSDKKVLSFTGTATSTFSMLIASMRVAHGLSNNVLLGHSNIHPWQGQPWFKELFSPLIKYLSIREYQAFNFD